MLTYFAYTGATKTIPKIIIIIIYIISRLFHRCQRRSKFHNSLSMQIIFIYAYKSGISCYNTVCLSYIFLFFLFIFTFFFYSKFFFLYLGAVFHVHFSIPICARARARLFAHAVASSTESEDPIFINYTISQMDFS